MTTARKVMTADDLLALPDDGKRHELVRGELIEMPSPSVMHGIVADNFGWLIGGFVRANNLDFVSTSEVGIYIEQDPDTVRAADYTLISRQRIAAPIPPRGYVLDLVPDLVVEVVAPGYSSAAVNDKTRMWLDAGVRLVMTAYSDDRAVVAHRDDGTIERFGVDDILTAAPVLPGFSCAVADIFPY